MTTHNVKVQWLKSAHETFIDNKYSRAHQWLFENGQVVQASAYSQSVPAPFTNSENIDPKQAFIASVSSCHMLFFLSIAAKKGTTVESYVDNSIGLLKANKHGNIAITDIILKPQVCFAGEQPSKTAIAKMHNQAHKQCFLANSIQSKIHFHINEMLN